MRILSLITLILVLLVSSCQSQGQTKVVIPNASSSQIRLSDSYVPSLPARAKSYQAAHRWLLLASLLWRLAGFYVILQLALLPKFLQKLEVWKEGWKKARSKRREESEIGIKAKHGFIAALIATAPGVFLCFAAYSLLTVLWNLPIGLASLAIEWRYGFSHESFFSYLKDLSISFGIGLSYTLLLIPGYMIFAKFPKRWWLFVWAAIVPVSFISAVIYPVAISPLFNTYRLMESSRLRDRIQSLAMQAGIRGADIFIEDTSKRTSHVNAYVIGIGPSTRIVLNDTALRELPEDQLLAMMGHEMGHYKEKHIWIGLFAGALGVGFFLWLLAETLPKILRRHGVAWQIPSLNSPASIPLIFAGVYLITLLGQPIGNAVSRHLEHRADIFGLKLTHLNEATARLFVGFAERDFSDPDPPFLLHFWFGTHPTLKERIDFARNFPNSTD